MASSPLPLTPGDASASAGRRETTTQLGFAGLGLSYASLVGTYQYQVSQPKKISSALGRVEVVEVNITSELTDDYGDFSDTTFSLLVNPAIGLSSMRSARRSLSMEQDTMEALLQKYEK